MRFLFKSFACLALAAFVAHTWISGHAPVGRGSASRTGTAQIAPSVARTWGDLASLPDHFARHGAQFGARNAEDYARLAAQFLQRAKAEGLPAKIDYSGVVRVFDPRSGTFGAYNPDGTTKTFFKPGSPGYFDRQ